MGNQNLFKCPLLQTYDTIEFLSGPKADARRGVVLELQDILGKAQNLVNSKYYTSRKVDRLPNEFNMTLYKLLGNNINKRMPIWKSINGAASIALLKGRGKQFLIIGEIHCRPSSPYLCLSKDNPTNPANLLADLARYSPSFLDIYTEVSEIEYWSPGNLLSGFLGQIPAGPKDLTNIGKSRRGLPCMDFQWIHRASTRTPKDAWKLGICLTSRWHYTDVRQLEQAEIDKILGLRDEEIKETERKYIGRGREGVDVTKRRKFNRFLKRTSATIEFMLWEGIAGGTAGGDIEAFNGSSPYKKNLNKKIGPKLFFEWIKKNLSDTKFITITKFLLLYNNPYKLSYYNIRSKIRAKMSAPIFRGRQSGSSLYFPLWKLAKEIGINISAKDTNTSTSIKSFLDLIMAYATLLNPHMQKIIHILAKLNNLERESSNKDSIKVLYNNLTDLMFIDSFLKGSPRMYKSLSRTSEKEAILLWVRTRYQMIIKRWNNNKDKTASILDALIKQNPNELGTGVYTNSRAYKFDHVKSLITPYNIIEEIQKLGQLFVQLSVINMDCYTISRMFKKFNVPEGVNQPEEPHTCVLYFGDSHAINVTDFLSHLPGIKLLTSNNNTERIMNVRPFPALGGNRKCCLELGPLIPQPLLWPFNTDQKDFPIKY